MSSILSYAVRQTPGGRARRPSPFLAEALDREPAVARRRDRHARGAGRPGASRGRVAGCRSRRRPAAGPLTLSHSQVDDYLACPLKYRLRHLVRVPTPPHHALVVGNALHQAVAAWHLGQLRGTPAGRGRACSTRSRAHWSSEGFLSRDHEEARFEAGRAALRRFLATPDGRRTADRRRRAALPGAPRRGRRARALRPGRRGTGRRRHHGLQVERRARAAHAPTSGHATRSSSRCMPSPGRPRPARCRRASSCGSSTAASWAALRPSQRLDRARRRPWRQAARRHPVGRLPGTAGPGRLRLLPLPPHLPSVCCVIRRGTDVDAHGPRDPPAAARRYHGLGASRWTPAGTGDAPREGRVMSRHVVRSSCRPRPCRRSGTSRGRRPGPATCPTYAGPVTWCRRPYLPDPAALRQRRPDVAILGMPFDDRVSHRPGARFGPRAIRQATRDDRRPTRWRSTWSRSECWTWSTPVTCRHRARLARARARRHLPARPRGDVERRRAHRSWVATTPSPGPWSARSRRRSRPDGWA